MEMKKRRSKMLCAYCGKPNAGTRDDVIPATMFLSPRPANNIRVFSCESCNYGFQKDEQYFRFFILLGGNYQNPEARKLWELGMRPYFRRSPDFAASLLNGIRRVEVRSKAGIILGTADQYIANDARLDRVLKKISMGLYYHLERKPLRQVDFVIRMFRQVEEIPEEVRLLLTPLHTVQMGPVRFRYGRVMEDDRYTLTAIQFYSSPVFFILTSPEAGSDDLPPTALGQELLPSEPDSRNAQPSAAT